MATQQSFFREKEKITTIGKTIEASDLITSLLKLKIAHRPVPAKNHL